MFYKDFGLDAREREEGARQTDRQTETETERDRVNIRHTQNIHDGSRYVCMLLETERDKDTEGES